MATDMDISLILVEYFCTDTLREAVQSIFAHVSSYSFEIIVVSNSSYSQEKQAEIKSNFSKVDFIFNQKNLGFGRAVNQGIRKSSGKFVCLLNPDAKLIDRSLEKALKAMDKNEKIAVIGPHMLDSTGQVQDSCRKFLTFSTMLKRMYRRISGRSHGSVLEDKNYTAAHQVDWVSGACLLARKKAIVDAGLMDERYFMYVEDMDWCRNFQRFGWQTWFLPGWSVEHNAGRASSGRICLMNKLMWIHFLSFCKYTIKWTGKRYNQCKYEVPNVLSL
jgi:N-acetylglucosaminyl-diphospho-decaprenol L-rhamnosyltransferase